MRGRLWRQRGGTWVVECVSGSARERDSRPYIFAPAQWLFPSELAARRFAKRKGITLEEPT